MATGREREAPIFRLDSENKIRAPYKCVSITAFLYIASPSSKKKAHTGSGLARSGPAAGKQTAAASPDGHSQAVATFKPKAQQVGAS